MRLIKEIEMKIRESGMPDEQKWYEFFDPTAILPRLGLDAACGDVVEFGCGYGTFTLAAARIISGTVYCRPESLICRLIITASYSRGHFAGN